MPSIVRATLSRADFRFEIRPYELADISGLYEAADESREEVSRWMAWLHPKYNRQDAAAWTAHAMEAWDHRTEYEFVIHDRDDDGRVSGSCGLNQLHPKDRFCNLGYWVRSSKQRLGAAAQAVTLLREFAFSRLNLNRLEIVVAEGNTASRGVAEKVGAIYEGRQRDRVCVGDAVHDGHMYALLRDPASRGIAAAGRTQV